MEPKNETAAKLARNLTRARARYEDALAVARDAWHGSSVIAFDRAEKALKRAAAAVDRADDAIEIAEGRRPVIELFFEALAKARATRLGATVVPGYVCADCGASGLATSDFVGAACVDCAAFVALDAEGEAVAV